MSKFWVAALFVLFVGLSLLLGNFGDSGSINFSDLETECRLGSPEAEVGLSDSRLQFNGHFPVEDSDASVNYQYRQSSDRVVLEIRSDPTGEKIDFLDDCLASVKYRAESEPLKPGLYHVEVRHDGEKAHSSVVKVG
ncbi:MAG: hypothetical protein ABEJ03_03435 [Candidatus Nanohaloarchaea archaeon]